jgi:hypothetical protein
MSQHLDQTNIWDQARSNYETESRFPGKSIGSEFEALENQLVGSDSEKSLQTKQHTRAISHRV